VEFLELLTSTFSRSPASRNFRIKEGVSPAGVNRDLAVYRAAFNFAVERRLLTHSPLDGVRLFNETKPRKAPRVLSFSEERRILMCCDLRLRTLIIVLVDTGMRVGIEALKLKWIDVDFEESMITVAQSKTASRLHTLPMTPRREIRTPTSGGLPRTGYRSTYSSTRNTRVYPSSALRLLGILLSEWQDFPDFPFTSAAIPVQLGWQHQACRIRSSTSCSDTPTETCSGLTPHGLWTTCETRWCASINFEPRRPSVHAVKN
jgi:integrase